MPGGKLSDLLSLSNNFFDPFTDLERRTRDSHTSVNSHLRPSFRMGSNASGDSNIYAGIPRPKFLFGAKFYRKISTNGLSIVDGSDIGNTKTAFMLKYLDRPKISFDVEELNQYNKKRLVHTGVKYQPLTVRFYDSVDDRALELFKDYFEYYFGDGRKITSLEWTRDIYNQEFLDSGTGWGFNPEPYKVGGLANFFSKIEIYHFFGGLYNIMTVVNPKIETFDHDSNDYTDGTTGSEIMMQIKFEGIVYSKKLQPITEAMAEEFGFDYAKSDYLKLDNAGQTGALSGIPDLRNIRTQILDAAGVPTAFRNFIPNLPEPVQSTLNTVSGVNSALGSLGRYAHAASEGAARASSGTRTPPQ